MKRMGKIIFLTILLIFLNLSITNCSDKKSAGNKKIKASNGKKIITITEKNTIPTELIDIDHLEYTKNQTKYVPKVLVKMKWGTGPGEIANTAYEGDFYDPQGFWVNSKCDIWFLDTFNNRILHFDKNGKYIDKVKVESYKRETDARGYDYSDFTLRGILEDENENIWLYTTKDDSISRPKSFRVYDKKGKLIKGKMLKDLNKVIKEKHYNFVYNDEKYE